MRIFAAPFDGGPLRMLAHPLRDIGWSTHDALPQREVGRKCQVPFLAGVWREHGTHRDDQVYRIHAETLRRKAITRQYTPIAQPVTKPAVARFHQSVKQAELQASLKIES